MSPIAFRLRRPVGAILIEQPHGVGARCHGRGPHPDGERLDHSACAGIDPEHLPGPGVAHPDVAGDARELLGLIPGGNSLDDPAGRWIGTTSLRPDAITQARPPPTATSLGREVGTPRARDCPARPPLAVAAEPRSRMPGAGRRARSPRTSGRARSTGAARRSYGDPPRSRGRAAGWQRSGDPRGSRADPALTGSNRGGH
jgi:hypothetical protein